MIPTDSAACLSPLSSSISQRLLKFLSIESGIPSNHLILCCPLLLSPSIFPSIRVFSNGSALCIRWTKYWGFSFSISPSNEYPGLICFCIDKFDLAVQATLKSLLQHHSSKTLVLQCSAFFIVQLSHPHMTAGKNHSFDYSDLCEQSDVCFLTHCLGWSYLFFQRASIF